MDLLRFTAEPTSPGSLVLRPGDDPLEIGLISVLTSTA
jgi:hypothetical protein